MSSAASPERVSLPQAAGPEKERPIVGLKLLDPMATKTDKQIDKRHISITPVDLESMAERGESIYQAIAITARRARQINDEIKTEYQARISTLVPVELDEDEEFETPNFDQLRISLEIDKLGKPTLEALDEFGTDKLEFRFRERD